MIAGLYSVTLSKKMKLNVLKKGNKYTVVSFDKIQLKDVLQFTAPTSLSKFLKQWGVQETKSIFPYEKYGSVEEVWYAKTFPPYSAFYSTLKQENVTVEEYVKAKKLFDEKCALPVSDRKRWKSMLDWLKYYNLLDCRPLVQALENCFDSFHTYFKVNALSSVSLPSLAFTAMFMQFDSNMATSASFCAKNDEIRKLFRSNVIGGLTTVTHRHINLEDENGPHNSRFAPNGDKFTYVSFWDFNSMYLWSQTKEQPLTPGILWEPKSNAYTKSVMTHGVSLGQVQWINYIQQTDLCRDNESARIQVQHAYFRGEVKKAQYTIDGYFVKNGEEVFLEYQGKFCFLLSH